VGSSFFGYAPHDELCLEMKDPVYSGNDVLRSQQGLFGDSRARQPVDTVTHPA
jgi:hypothetical protein